jgi:hypothetical protein
MREVLRAEQLCYGVDMQGWFQMIKNVIAAGRAGASR